MACDGEEGLRPPIERITSPLRTGRLESLGAFTTSTPSFVPKYSPRSGFRFTSSRSPQGDPNDSAQPSMPGISGISDIPGATRGIVIAILGISIRNEALNSSATRVAFLESPPRRYSSCTVSPGSSLRANSTSLAPGPDSSSASDLAPASDVLLNWAKLDADLEPRLRGGSARRHGVQLRPDLVCLGIGLGVYDHADPAVVVAHRVGVGAWLARGTRGAWRPLRGKHAGQRASERRANHNPLRLHN